MAESTNDSTLIRGRALERYFDLHKAHAAFHEMFKYDSGDDRAIVVFGGSFLDMLLDHILLSFLSEGKESRRLLEYNQPFGAYGYQLCVTHSLGVIETVVKCDLKLIGKIRNKFVHDLYASSTIKTSSHGVAI